MVGLALAGAAVAPALAQTPPDAAAPPGPLDRTQQVGAWTVKDVGAKPGDDSDREVSLRREIPDVELTLFRTDRDGAGLSMKFARCDGLNLNSGFSFEGAIPARAAQLRAEIDDAFKDFAKACPPKAGEKEALVEGLDAADAVLETWLRDKPFTYPPEPAETPAAKKGK
jgi:hypothetical protein